MVLATSSPKIKSRLSSKTQNRLLEHLVGGTKEKAKGEMECKPIQRSVVNEIEKTYYLKTSQL